MSKLTKNQKLALGKIEAGKAYTLKEASALVKEITTTKFDASVDVDVRLGVDPRKANQMVRGVVSLPHGTGKQVRVLALCTPDKEAEATAAGADYVGLDEYINKIKGGWTDIDVIITMPFWITGLPLITVSAFLAALEIWLLIWQASVGAIFAFLRNTSIPPITSG